MNAIEIKPAFDIDAPIEEVAQAHQKLKSYLAVGREMEKAFKAACIAHIKAHGPIRYTVDAEGSEMILTVGHRKETKCRDVRKASEFLMGLDLDRFVDCLSTNAIKHGAVRKVLKEFGDPARFDELFVEVVKDTLDGLPKEKELIEVDTTWSNR